MEQGKIECELLKLNIIKMEELTEDFEILIVAWLESDNENVTELAHSLSELAKKRALILPVVVKSVKEKEEKPIGFNAMMITKKDGEQTIWANGKEHTIEEYRKLMFPND